MAYSRYYPAGWKNKPDPSTPVRAEALDHIEDGILAVEAELSGYQPALPGAGTYTYNGDGTIASDPDGNTYTWNTDGTVATVTKAGVTRTASYNTDGTIAGWA